MISKYNLNDNEFIGIVKDIKYEEDYIKLYIDDLLISFKSKEKYNLGDKLKVSGSIGKPKEEDNFNLFNYRNYLYSKGIHYLVTADSVTLINKNNNILYKLKTLIIKHIDTYKTSNYLKTFILADNSLIDSSVKESYQINGISHLFAVSGMHVSLLTGIILYFNKWLKKKNILNIITIFFLILYIFLTNASASIIRAVFLFISCLINKKYKLNLKNEYIIIYILLINLILNPYNIYNSGFLFSYTISFFLIRYASISNRFSNYFIKLLVISTISFVSSLPISINSYHSVNLLTPIINIIFVPLISIFIFPLSLIVFIIKPLDDIFFIIINLLEKLSIIISKINITLIFSHLSLLFFIFYYLIIIFVFNKIKNNEYKYISILIILVLIHYNINLFNIYPSITVINVGQGDSILITLPHNKGNILVDCSNTMSFNDNDYNTGENTIIPYLKSEGIKKLDYLIITHGDYDHIGSIEYILNNYKVSNVIFNSGKINNNEASALKIIKEKKINYFHFSTNVLKINKYIFNFINDIDISNENEDSLIIYTILNNKKILLMGDAGFESEEYILNEYNINNIDILKVGHHGSKYSTSEYFISQINPKYSLISVGANNKFNHPSSEALSNLSLSKTYLTSINGSIKMILAKKILVKSVR